MKSKAKVKSQAEYLSTVDVARKLGLHPETIKRYAHDGKLKPYYLSSKTLRFKICEVEQFMQDAKAA